jgi:hypothetical protein
MERRYGLEQNFTAFRNAFFASLQPSPLPILFLHLNCAHRCHRSGGRSRDDRASAGVRTRYFAKASQTRYRSVLNSG